MAITTPTYSYDKPLMQSITLPSHDFGAGALATALKRPPGVRYCRIIDMGVVNITEAFTDDTLPAYIKLGTASDDDKFAKIGMAEAAATNAWGIRDDSDAVLDADGIIDMDNDGDSGAAINQIEVALTAPTGGTPAGIACPFFCLAWW